MTVQYVPYVVALPERRASAGLLPPTRLPTLIVAAVDMPKGKLM